MIAHFFRSFRLIQVWTTSGIPPTARYSPRRANNLLWTGLLSGSAGSCLMISSTIAWLSWVATNSRKDTGYMYKDATRPTGIPMFSSTKSRREPAAMTWSSGSNSWKYLSDLTAFGASCISSKKRSVLPGTIFTPVNRPRSRIMRWGSRLRLKMSASWGLISKLISTKFSKFRPSSRQL